MGDLVLSLFPGIGLLDMAFEEAGFCVVRGPDLLWGGDVRTFAPPAGRFDGVIGGPPCQAFSAMKRLNPRAGEKHGNMIPEFERVVAAAGPTWFLMENVEGAPLPDVLGYRVHAQMLRHHWVGGETSRLRRFSFGTRDGRALRVETLALCRPDPLPAVLAGGNGRAVPVAIGGSGKRKKTLTSGAVVRGGPNPGARASFADMLAGQDLPVGFLSEAPFSESGKKRMIGNGVPLAMGRAVAAAVRRAIGQSAEVAA
ncbi:DNA cytosine methyltransferase [Methylobacterium terrae]|uniref:DNA cytosine methyltransferase n=1 Tax=Methylobacterium terrae TaxID=2202827 RepID=UPI001FE0A77A|nr:DNA cytosine methyltransferase [Methylobacterium terrae]